MSVDNVIGYIRDTSGATAIPLRFSQIVFEERVKLSCYQCAKYGRNWHCPPNLPSVDFKMALSEYGEMLLVYQRFVVVRTQAYESVRYESSISLHKLLLRAEKVLWDNGCVAYASFIGGSCKLCKNGCESVKCANPESARIPFEALGVNVVKTAANVGVDVTFPPQNSIMRVGLLCW